MTLQASPPAPAATICRPPISAATGLPPAPSPLAADHDRPSLARLRPPSSLAAALYRLAFLLLRRLAVGPRPSANDAR